MKPVEPDLRGEEECKEVERPRDDVLVDCLDSGRSLDMEERAGKAERRLLELMGTSELLEGLVSSFPSLLLLDMMKQEGGEVGGRESVERRRMEIALQYDWVQRVPASY